MEVVTCDFTVVYHDGSRVTVPQQVHRDEIETLAKHYLQAEKAFQILAHVEGEQVAKAE